MQQIFPDRFRVFVSLEFHPARVFILREIMSKSKEVNYKRQIISKKIRFEVFKRDNFTCQYCGRKAPDVILQIDHLKPVAHGGGNDILNLITSCVECNQGKGAREISDDTAIKRKQKQAEILAERLEQIEMLRDWHVELANQSNAEIEAVNSLFVSLTNGKYEITDTYKNLTIKKLIENFGLAHVLESLSEGAKNYGDPEKALNKLPGICACRKDPVLHDKNHILNILNRRLTNFDRKEASKILSMGLTLCGVTFFEYMKDRAYSAFGSWKIYKKELCGIIISFYEGI